jgi:DNA processing protein
VSDGQLTRAARLDWLRLARTENVGPVTFAQLVGRYGDASAAIAALPSLAMRGGRATPPRTLSISEAERELDAVSAWARA